MKHLLEKRIFIADPGHSKFEPRLIAITSLYIAYIQRKFPHTTLQENQWILTNATSRN